MCSVPVTPASTPSHDHSWPLMGFQRGKWSFQKKPSTNSTLTPSNAPVLILVFSSPHAHTWAYDIIFLFSTHQLLSIRLTVLQKSQTRELLLPFLKGCIYCTPEIVGHRTGFWRAGRVTSFECKKAPVGCVINPNSFSFWRVFSVVLERSTAQGTQSSKEPCCCFGSLKCP